MEAVPKQAGLTTGKNNKIPPFQWDFSSKSSLFNPTLSAYTETQKRGVIIMSNQVSALAIHDISCVGKCSLTVALPILSAAGIETSVLPTSVLSTHTGGFTGWTFHDLTGEVEPITRHWASLGLRFDGIYTGYLGSKEQIALIMKIFDDFGQDALKVVDPVMGDNGALYGGFSADFPQEMKRLCAKADVIVPNFTEASLMLEEPYQEGPYTKSYVEDILHKLALICPGQVVLTGVRFDDKQLGAAVLDVPSGRVEYAQAPLIPGYYHGTGDVFASALTSAMLRGKGLGESAQIAADFTVAAIRGTDTGRDQKYGVNFEGALPMLMRALGII